MSDHGSHARLHEFFGRSDRLRRIAIIIDHQELDLLAEDATRRIQLGNLHVHALLHLLAEPSQRASHWARRADQDLGVGERAGAEGDYKCRHKSYAKMLHGLPSLTLIPAPAAPAADRAARKSR
jgi:hypothetical protein